MTFKVIDTKTGKEPTARVIHNIAKKGELITTDIDQFFVGEDGSLVLADDCGNMTYCDTDRFRIEPSVQPIRPKGEWLNKELFPDDITGHIHGECSVCGKVRIIDNYCPNCGADMGGRE